MCSMMAPSIDEIFINRVREEYLEAFEDVFARDEYQDAETLRDQIGILCYYLRDMRDQPVPYEVIGDFFDLSKGDVAYHEKKYKNPPRNNGRPPLLTEDEVTEMLAFIGDSFANDQAPTYQMINDHIFEVFRKEVKMGSLRNIISNIDCLKTEDAIPIDKNRYECDSEEVLEYYNDLNNYIDHVPAQFIINVDESGFQPYQDAKKMRVVVPIDFEETIYYGANQSVSRNSLIAGIFADGTYTKPLIVIDRKTIEEELIVQGYNESIVAFKFRSNGFIDTQIFNDWADEILFPELEKRRETYNYNGGAVVILDGCSCHCNDYFLDECIYRKIFPIFLVPHSSDQTQMLDLGIFGIQKKNISKIRPEKNLSSQSKQIIKILNSWFSVATPSNITSAYKQAGLVPFMENGTLYYKVDLDYARCLRHNPGSDAFIAEFKNRIKIA